MYVGEFMDQILYVVLLLLSSRAMICIIRVIKIDIVRMCTHTHTHTHSHIIYIRHICVYILLLNNATSLIYKALLCINSNTKSVMSRAHSAPAGGGAPALCFSSLVSALLSYKSGASWLAHVLIGSMSNANPTPNRPHLRISSFSLQIGRFI